MKRYLPAAAALAITIASAVALLFLPGRPPALLLLVAVGAPITALLLATGASGFEGRPGRVAGAVIIGATAIPAMVLALRGGVAAAAWLLVEPLAEAGRGLLDALDAEPTVLEVLTNPWAVVFLVELAVVAPLIEEGLKPLGAVVMRPGSRRGAFVLGAAVGAGFAAAENIMYASGWLFSSDAWLPVALLRSCGAAIHLLGAGVVAVAVYERRAGLADRLPVWKAFLIATGLHATWNGTIAVAVVLFNGREVIAGGLGGDAQSWGVSLSVLLTVLGIVALGGVLAAGRWSSGDEGGGAPFRSMTFDRPEVVAGWAGIGVVLLVPITILVLAFPEFLAL
jgi:RsiW-degrading membrane proteinase PrsW (M82 family)